MPLVPGICTQCGATLSADNSKDCMICPYCGTPFIVEKAINHFQNTYNISNSVVNFYGEECKDFVIRAGVLEKYKGENVVVTIPDNVTVIGEGAFSGCYGLKKVTIPEGVVCIEARAFHCCRVLEEIVLPNTVEKIGSSAFADCEALSMVVFSSKLKAIESAAFYGCRQLTKISLPDSLLTIGNRCFEGCSNLATIKMPNNKYTSCYRPNTVFQNCDNLHEFEVLDDSWRFMLDSSKGYERRKKRINQGVCTYCGGKFKGWATKVCKACGREKDYR